MVIEAFILQVCTEKQYLFIYRNENTPWFLISFFFFFFFVFWNLGRGEPSLWLCPTDKQWSFRTFEYRWTLQLTCNGEIHHCKYTYPSISDLYLQIWLQVSKLYILPLLWQYILLKPTSNSFGMTVSHIMLMLFPSYKIIYRLWSVVKGRLTQVYIGALRQFR